MGKGTVIGIPVKAAASPSPGTALAMEVLKVGAKMAANKIQQAAASRASTNTSSVQRKAPPRTDLAVVAAPAAKGAVVGKVRTQTTRSPNGATMKGRAWLGSVITADTGVTGNGFFVGAFTTGSNPATFLDRIATEARLYEKYRYKRATLIYLPSVGTNTAGTVYVTARHDYAGEPAQNVANALDLPTVAGTPVWRETAVTITAQSAERRTYYTNYTTCEDIHESEQFRFEVYVSGATAADLLMGQIFLDFELELYNQTFVPPSMNIGIGTWSVAKGSWSYAGATNVTSVSVLPAANAGSSVTLWELFVPAFSGASMVIGNGGGSVDNSPTGPFRIYIKRGAGNAYIAFLSLRAATSGTEAGSSVYALGPITPVNNKQIWFRPLSDIDRALI